MFVRRSKMCLQIVKRALMTACDVSFTSNIAIPNPYQTEFFPLQKRRLASQSLPETARVDRKKEKQRKREEDQKITDE